MLDNRCPHQGGPLCLGRLSPWAVATGPGHVAAAAALAPRRHRAEAQFVVQPAQFALARLAIGFGVARVALRFLVGLRAGVLVDLLRGRLAVGLRLRGRLRARGARGLHVLGAEDLRGERFRLAQMASQDISRITRLLRRRDC